MKRGLLFEIGAEEIPSDPLYQAISQLKADAEEMLSAARLDYGVVDVFGSPRRLVLRVTDLAEKQTDQAMRVRGPAIKAAFDSEGNPTKAAEGFAHGKGVSVADLESVEDESGAYVYAVVESPGQEAIEVLPGILGNLVAGLDWSKSMRWGSGETRFSRPVRWLLALFGSEVLPVTFAGLEAGRTTYGHRFLTPGPIEVGSVAEYDSACRRGLVLYDHTERAALVREGIDSAVAEQGASAVVPETVFAEVVNLVEWPTVGIGRFDEEFLDVPREVLETAMESHQRYFPVEGPGGDLLPDFVVVHNGDPERTKEIVAGHERVIRARLADAAFFYQEDLARPFESYVADLETIVFQERLGTLGARVARVEALTARLAELTGADHASTAEAVRAAHLCKADLVTQVVVEFPSLQGVMGRYYALAAGESESVANAIPEHYQPRFAGDALPQSSAGRLVSIADKLDIICGIFAIGMVPTGSADPYALRRGALGILGIVLDGMPLTLDEAISAAFDGYSVTLDIDRNTVGPAVKEFITGRFEGILRDKGHAYDTVAAILGVAADDPADALARCEALSALRAESDVMENLSIAFTRAKNLAEETLGTAADPNLMGTEEAALTEALADAEERAAKSLAAGDHASTLGVLASLRGPIDAFFDNVLVMAPEEELRVNRLRLLNRFVALFESFADFRRLAG